MVWSCEENKWGATRIPSPTGLSSHCSPSPVLSGSSGCDRSQSQGQRLSDFFYSGTQDARAEEGLLIRGLMRRGVWGTLGLLWVQRLAGQTLPPVLLGCSWEKSLWGHLSSLALRRWGAGALGRWKSPEAGNGPQSLFPTWRPQDQAWPPAPNLQAA